MKAPQIITSMARALGIVSSVEEVAIVPLEQWHRVFERAEDAERARDEVGIQYAAAQAMIARMQPVVDAARVAASAVELPALSARLAALDTVPGDVLARRP